MAASTTTGAQNAGHGYTETFLDEVRANLAASDKVLGLARERRGLVLKEAMSFDGARRKYYSGSIAHATANADLDADCGIVLDRRRYPELGPDGNGVGPVDVVDYVRELVASGLETGVTVVTTKRAITATFDSPAEGFDPSVDLIVGLERREDPGIWIPNLPANGWDPSHPEKHTDLFTSGSLVHRRIRARVVRLAKGWNGQYEEPALSSFNLEALAWMCVVDGMSQAEALGALFAFGARDLDARFTPDPADVSPAIKTLLDRSTAVGRLTRAASLVQVALEHDDDETAVQETLAQLFWKYIDPPSGSSSAAAWAAGLRTGNAGVSIGASGLTLGSAGSRVKDTRSWADDR